MLIKPYQSSKWLLALMLVLSAVACANNSDTSRSDNPTHIIEPSSTHAGVQANAKLPNVNVTSEGNDSGLSIMSHQTATNELELLFVDKPTAVAQLASQDEYINALSLFDWQAKFKSDHPLSQSELSDYYSNAVMDWDDTNRQRVVEASRVLEQRLEELGINHPSTLNFILTNGLVEASSAYTRENYIVLPADELSMMRTQEQVNHLLAHEFFHVYSWLHKDERDALYGTLGFSPLNEAVVLSEYPLLPQRVITNPDALTYQYGINLQWDESTYTFVPVILAIKPYDTTTNLPFFEYVFDGLLAVNADGKMISNPYSSIDAPIIVPKRQTNYDEVVQPNSDYLNHPEEVLAENFSLYITEGQLTHPEPVQRLIDVMRSLD